MVWGWYLDIFEKVIPDVLAIEDPDRFYWPTSPSSLVDHLYEINTGDIHYYGVGGG